MHAREKRLNEMNRLTDMLHFPALVNAGATANVLLTVLATWWVAPRYLVAGRRVGGAGARAEPSAGRAAALVHHPADRLPAARPHGFRAGPAQVFRLGVRCGLGRYGVLDIAGLDGCRAASHAAGAGAGGSRGLSGDFFAGDSAWPAGSVAYQPRVPAPPLNGPRRSLVIQPP